MNGLAACVQREFFGRREIFAGHDRLQRRIGEHAQFRHRQEAAVERQPQVAVREVNRPAHRDELGAILEHALDLHLVDQLRHAGQHLVVAENRAAELHQLRHRMPAVANQLEDHAGDQRHRLRVVQAQAARQAPLGELADAGQG